MEADRVTRVLRQFLQTDQLLGVDATPVNRRAVAAAVDAPGAPQAGTAPAAGASDAPQVAPPVAPVPDLDLGDGTAEQRLARLADLLAADPDLAPRFAGGPPTLGVGGLPARVLFVGEPLQRGADHTEEDKLLEGMVKAMKLSPGDVFRCPCLPFAPAAGGHPSPAELSAGAAALKAQVLLAAPEAVVAMGGAAAKALLGVTTGITSLRGTFSACPWTDPPVPVMPTLSPSFVLRSYTKSNRMMVWDDLQQVMNMLAK